MSQVTSHPVQRSPDSLLSPLPPISKPRGAVRPPKEY
jgi:hypothetical protein